jgi:hypothetical protein
MNFYEKEDSKELASSPSVSFSLNFMHIRKTLIEVSTVVGNHCS